MAELSHEGDYVCSSTASFKRLDYLKLAREAAENDANNKTQWNRMKRETYYLGANYILQIAVLKTEAPSNRVIDRE